MRVYRRTVQDQQRQTIVERQPTVEAQTITRPQKSSISPAKAIAVQAAEESRPMISDIVDVHMGPN